MRRTVAVVAVVALVALAGCGGNGGTTTVDEGNRETTTTEDVATTAGGPTTTTAEETATTATAQSTTTTAQSTTTTAQSTTTTAQSTTTTPDVALPPGTSRQGITDWEVLQSAHASATAGTDFRASSTFREVLNGTDSPPQRTVIRVDAAASSSDRRLFLNLQVTRVGGTNSTRTSYLENGTTYSRRAVDEEVSYDVSESFTFQQARADLAVASLRNKELYPLRWEWTVAGTTTVDGRDAVRYSLAGLGRFAEGTEVRQANGTAVVDTRGVVHSLDANVRLVDPGEGQREISFTHRYEPASSVDVDSPDWLEAARNATEG